MLFLAWGRQNALAFWVETIFILLFCKYRVLSRLFIQMLKKLKKQNI